MEIECALYAIPLLFVRQEEGRQTPGVGCIPNIASILELPFNRRRIIETIERQLPGCRELIQTIFTDHLLAATSKVLNLASNTDASCTDIRHDQGFQWPAESTGFMSLSGAVEGAVAISFPYDLAAEVAIGMSGLKRSELSDSDIEEVSGEIVNQIAGQARTDLWLPEFRFDITLPLAINKACAGSNENDDGWTIASLQSDDHTFYLQVFIKEVHPTPAATTERKPDSKPPCPVAD